MFIPQGSLQVEWLTTDRAFRGRLSRPIVQLAILSSRFRRHAFAPFGQINRDNVGQLEVAWTFRTGEINGTTDFVATPLQIDNSIYFCTAHNRIFALDADTGRKRWSFDPEEKSMDRGTDAAASAISTSPGRMVHKLPSYLSPAHRAVLASSQDHRRAPLRCRCADGQAVPRPRQSRLC